MRKSLAVLAAALLFAACSLLPKPPDPGPTPTPPPQWSCELGMPGCHKTKPPQQCSSEVSPCWHNPTQDPEHCEEAPACDVTPPDLPQPQCETFTDRGGTFRTRSGQCDCYFGQAWTPCPKPPPTGCAAETNLIATTCFEQEFRDEVKMATDILGDRCGRDWKENLDAVVEQLRIQMPGRCVISGNEAVFIARNDGRYEENHTAFSHNGCWTNSGFGKYIGCHVNVTPTRECVDPDPTDLGAEFVLKKHGNDWDSTYRVRNRGYCDAVCSPKEPDVCFTGRNACPLRFEGDPERKVCEEQEIGDQKWWCNGQSIDSNANPAQARCHGHVKTCTENDRTCAEADW